MRRYPGLCLPARGGVSFHSQRLRSRGVSPTWNTTQEGFPDLRALRRTRAVRGPAVTVRNDGVGDSTAGRQRGAAPPGLHPGLCPVEQKPFSSRLARGAGSSVAPVAPAALKFHANRDAARLPWPPAALAAPAANTKRTVSEQSGCGPLPPSAAPRRALHVGSRLSRGWARPAVLPGAPRVFQVRAAPPARKSPVAKSPWPGTKGPCVRLPVSWRSGCSSCKISNTWKQLLITSCFCCCCWKISVIF